MTVEAHLSELETQFARLRETMEKCLNQGLCGEPGHEVVVTVKSAPPFGGKQTRSMKGAS
jgi:hypothetical protein